MSKAQDALDRFYEKHPVAYNLLSMVVLLIELAVLLALLGWGVWALGKVFS